jgi:hypothetical protein
MSLAGFNPDVSLLTAHPNAQIHVFSGGAIVNIDKARADAMMKLIGLGDADIAAVKKCTGDYDKLNFEGADCNIIDYNAIYEKIKNGPYSGLLGENSESAMKSLVDAAAPAAPTVNTAAPAVNTAAPTAPDAPAATSGGSRKRSRRNRKLRVNRKKATSRNRTRARKNKL